MAKVSKKKASSRGGVSTDRVLGLCTAGERTLLASSESTSLANATRASVQALLVRARGIRDKWRGLFGQQTRLEKRANRSAATAANARSLAKADLFAGAVKRFEEHLTTLLPAAKPAAASKTKPKSARTAGHRITRAAVKANLGQKAATINRTLAASASTGQSLGARASTSQSLGARASTGQSLGARASTGQSLGTSASTQPVAVTAPKAKAPAAAAKPSKAAVRKLPPAKASTQAIRFDRAQQRSAKTAANSGRLKAEGLTTRRAGHTLAAGKRAQARRDKRSR